MTEAKRNAAIFINETDQLIQAATGEQQTPEQQLLSLLPKRQKIPDEINAHDLVFGVSKESQYLDEQKTVNPEYQRLHQLAKDVLDGSARPVHSADDLLKRAALLKDPAPGTVFEWTRYLTMLMEHSSREHIEQVTREDALAWRAEELSRCQASTVKNRLRLLNGLFGVALEEGWVQTNPFNDLTKRVKAKTKVKKVVLLDQADQTWPKLPQYHHLLWHILRWSGAHASEVGGLRWEDIDLQEEVIHFKCHETRPLKNAFRRRTVPIHSRLLPILRQEHIDEKCEGLMFPWAYNAERGRWCEGLHWQRYIGISPKATRNWAATCLRSKDINEMVIGKLFGHSPKTVTGRYGSVDMETMRRALDHLT